MERVYAPSTDVSTFITFPIGKRMPMIKLDLGLTKLLLRGILGVGCPSTFGLAMLWKVAAVIVAVGFVAGVVYNTCQQQNVACQALSERPNDGGKSSTMPSGTIHENQARETSKSDDGCTSCRNVLLKWPEGITAWAVILTLFVIAWQSAETARAARATETAVVEAAKQTELSRKSLIAQFRPRIAVRSVRFDPTTVAEFDAQSNPVWTIEICIVNAGDTVAHIRTCEAISFWRDNSRRSRAQIAKKEWPPKSLQPGEVERLLLPVEEPTHRSHRKIVEDAISRGNEVQEVPACMGQIFYDDDDGHHRETGFERKWDFKSRRFIPADDPETEYSD